MTRWAAIAMLLLGGTLGSRAATAGDAPPTTPPVRVRVATPDGTPVAGALVEAFQRAPYPVSWDEPHGVLGEIAAATHRPKPAAAATSGPDGVATMEGLRAAGWTVVASAPGRARAAIVVSIGDDAETRVASITLDAGRTLTGRVREMDGSPVAAATVFASPKSSPIPGGNPLLTTATTGADGAYRLDGLPRSVELRVAPPGALAASGETIDVARVSTFDVTLPPRGATVRGRVLDRADGKTVAGATVRIAAASESSDDVVAAAVATTDAEGRYVVEGLRGSSVLHVLVEHPGHLVFWNDRYESVDPTRLWLRRGARVTGCVRGPGGPIAGARVQGVAVGLPPLPRDFAGTAFAETDADGRYTLDGLPPGQTDIAIEPTGLLSPLQWVRGRGWSEVLPVRVTTSLDRETTCDITLRAGRRVSGRVLDSAGKPVAGVRVEASLAFGSKHTIRWTLYGAVVMTGKDGAYTLQGLPESTGVVIEARRDGLLEGSGWSDDRRPAWGKTDLYVGPAPHIRGRVLDDRDVPLPRARVELVPCWDPWNERDFRKPIELRVDDDGRFDAAVPCRDAYRVRAVADGFATSISRQLWIEHDSPGETVDLRLVPGATFSGTIVNSSSGRPVACAVVRASVTRREFHSIRLRENPPFAWDDDSASGVVAVTSADGRFRVSCLHRQEYVFRIDAPRCAPRWIVWDGSDPANAGDARICVGAPKDKPSGTIQGLVVDGDGRAVFGMKIEAEGPRVDRLAARPRAVSENSGKFEITGVDPGSRYRLLVERESIEPLTIPDVAPGGAPLKIVVQRIVDRPNATVGGTVRRRDGSPAMYGRLRLTRYGDFRQVTTVECDVKGRFRLRFLPAGKYRVDLVDLGPDGVDVALAMGEIETGTIDAALVDPR